MSGTRGRSKSPEKGKKHIIKGGFEGFEGNSAQQLQPRRCTADKTDTSWANVGETHRRAVRQKAEGLEATFTLSIRCKSNPPGQTVPEGHPPRQVC